MTVSKFQRRLPNILITGTPGTGKTTLSSLLATATSLQHINVGDIVKEHQLYESWDEEYHCYVVDEDKVCDYLEDKMTQGGIIIDFHTVDFFPERWFDVVVVLRTDNTELYSRLESRDYSDKKIQENVTAEIMQVILDDAHQSYNPDIVMELTSNTIVDMENNVEHLQKWTETWINSLPTTTATIS